MYEFFQVKPRSCNTAKIISLHHPRLE